MSWFSDAIQKVQDYFQSQPSVIEKAHSLANPYIRSGVSNYKPYVHVPSSSAIQVPSVSSSSYNPYVSSSNVNTGSMLDVYEFNANEAQKTREWQEYMSNTAHQREVADLKEAGLNPILSANGGAMAYSGAMASSSDSLQLAKLQAATQLQVARIQANSAANVASIYAGSNNSRSNTQFASSLISSLLHYIK